MQHVVNVNTFTIGRDPGCPEIAKTAKTAKPSIACFSNSHTYFRHDDSPSTT